MRAKPLSPLRRAAPPVRAAILAGLILAMLASMSACPPLLDDLLNMQAPQVLARSPSSDFADPSALESVSLRFSAPMNRPSVERAFSISEDDSPLPGLFAWSAEELRFTPLAGFSTGKSYQLVLGRGAEDLHGNSLMEEYSFRFRTGAENLPPAVTGHSPMRGESLGDPLQPLLIRFSEAVDQASFLAAFSLRPDAPGRLAWSADGKELSFIPASAWQGPLSYLVSIDRRLVDLSGNHLSAEYSFAFSVAGLAGLELQSVAREPGGQTLLPSGPGFVVNHGFEKNDRLRLRFNRPLEAAERARAVMLRPAAAWVEGWSVQSDELDMIFSAPLAWGGLYELECAGSCWRFVVDGPGSQPPSVAALYFCPDSAAGPPLFQLLGQNGTISLDGAVRACFDLYIRHAAGADIPLGAALEAFSVSASNSCAELKLNSVEPWPSNPPRPALAGETVFRFNAGIVQAPRAGVLSFRLAGTLSDSLGNRLGDDWLLMLNK